jgi:hypothetical protein
MYETQNGFTTQKRCKYAGLNGSFSAGNSSYLFNDNYDFIMTKRHDPLSISLTGNFGYFITNKMVLGGEIGYAFTSVTPTLQADDSWLKQNVNLFLFGIYTAAYCKISKCLYYVPQLDVMCDLGNAKVHINSTNHLSYNVLGISFIGHLFSFEYRPNNHFAMQISVVQCDIISLLFDNNTTYGRYSVSDWGTGNASVGLHYYF